MRTKPRTLHLDAQTFKRLEDLAGLRNVSKSAFLRSLINEEFLGDRLVTKLPLDQDYALKETEGVPMPTGGTFTGGS
jgi:hypothetical protein